MQPAPVSAAALGAVIVLFGLLAFASHGTELLKQWVLAPDSAAMRGVSADCRIDELEEENLSMNECALLVSNVQIQLESSPDWFRPVKLFLSTSGSLAALWSMFAGFALVHARVAAIKRGVVCFALLAFIDVAGLIASAGTGPLLRAQYLWPTMLWLFIHLSLLLAVWHSVYGSNVHRRQG